VTGCRPVGTPARTPPVGVARAGAGFDRVPASARNGRRLPRNFVAPGLFRVCTARIAEATEVADGWGTGHSGRLRSSVHAKVAKAGVPGRRGHPAVGSRGIRGGTCGANRRPSRPDRGNRRCSRLEEAGPGRTFGT
jgi:hypothetical protein